jgi:Cu2+-containing amine oxidase
MRDFQAVLDANSPRTFFCLAVRNYDYIVTYKFKLNGEFRVEIGSSGYIQSHFMPLDRGASDSMAYRLNTYTGGSVHDHTFGFKVDLDVGGEINSFKTHEHKMGPTLDALNAGRELEDILTEKPPYLLFDTMRYVEYNTVQVEEDSLIDVNPQAPKSWFFGDDTKKNKWGNTRAYHLRLDQNPSSLIPTNSHTLPAFNFANQMLGVTVYKEDEQTLTGFYDMNRLDDPQGDFYRYFDGESIVQEDIVAWVTLTALHLPTSENMPMTNNIVHGFTLEPHNFFDENPAMDLPHYLRMHPTEAEGDTRMEDLPAVETCTPFEFDSLTHTFSGV